jgi:hypothetical protein
MKPLLALLFSSAIALPAAAQPQHTYELFPHDRVFRSPIADPAEPRVFMSRLEVKRDGGGSAAAFSAAFLGLGLDFGLLRRAGADAEHAWQLSVFGSADSLFNLDLPGDALVNTDYRFGFPLTWRASRWSARARLYHQSSHLGDELILGGNAPRRIDMSFEAADLLVAWQRAGWRLYGGASQVLRTRAPSYDGSGVHAGFDYLSAASLLFGQRLIAGVDLKWLEPARPHSALSAKAGVMIGRHSLERRGLTLLVEAYEGFAPFGQFFEQEFRYRGVSLQFDF